MKAKKHLVALAAGLAASAAMAQSSVNVFGVLDFSLRQVKNGSSTMRLLGTDGIQSSRIGFRGTEDLGGGLKVGFWLESTLVPDTGDAGSGGKFWSRRSTLSLSGSFGELRLGRDVDPSYTNLAMYDPFFNWGMTGTLNIVSTLGSGVRTLVRTDNGVSYFTPSTLGGLFAHAMVAAGEGVAGNRYVGLRVGYDDSKLNTALSYGKTQTATTNDFKIMNAGISYNFGSVKPMVLYHRAEYGSREQVILEAGMTIPVASGEFKVALARGDASGAGTDGDDAKLVGVHYVHFLSKRTTLYVAAAEIRNSGKAAFSVATGIANQLGKKSTGFDLGIRHAF